MLQVLNWSKTVAFSPSQPIHFSTVKIIPQNKKWLFFTVEILRLIQLFFACFIENITWIWMNHNYILFSFIFWLAFLSLSPTSLPQCTMFIFTCNVFSFANLPVFILTLSNSIWQKFYLPRLISDIAAFIPFFPPTLPLWLGLSWSIFKWDSMLLCLGF